MKMESAEIKVNYEANVEAFIVPNKALVVSDFLFDVDDREAAYKLLARINEVHYEPSEDKLVEFWYVSPELGSENLVDHGFKINGQYCNCDYDIGRYLPYSMVKDHKEGDTIDVIWPYDDGSDVMKFILMHVTFKQSSYRYARFGKFEEVLEQVTK